MEAMIIKQTARKSKPREQDILISERSVLSTAGWYHTAGYETSAADSFDVLRACLGHHRSCPGNPTRWNCFVGSQQWSLLYN